MATSLKEDEDDKDDGSVFVEVFGGLGVLEEDKIPKSAIAVVK